MLKNYLVLITFLIILSSCEHVIDVDLNSSDPAFVVEGNIFKDSVGIVRLTKTTSYFSLEKPELIEDASITISDGNSSEELTYKGNGYYTGKTLIGEAEKVYQIEIKYNGIVYSGTSYMPARAVINKVYFNKSDSRSILNPNGEMVVTITCDFTDDPVTRNFYMLQFISKGELLERYYLLNEDKANSGSISNNNGTISFSESIFFNGGEVEVQLFSIDESVYNYFLQLSDVLFWKRRVMPPTPYNPKSNLNNGALGYFAAWAFDSRRILL